MDREVKAHWYRCRNCKTLMHTPERARSGSPYLCVTCRGWMTYLYFDTIPPDQAGRVVFNPFNWEGNADPWKR
jgi:hypothetical protein